MTNRIREIATIFDDEVRSEAFDELDESIYSTPGDALNEYEIREALSRLPEETISNQAHLWRLLIASPRSETAARFAFEWLKDKKRPTRGLSLRYIREHFAEAMDRLMPMFVDDEDPEVRFEIAEFLITTDPKKALDIELEILPSAPDWTTDQIISQFGTYGNATLLGRLQARADWFGWDTKFGRAAQHLEAKLQTSSPRQARDSGSVRNR